jgi:hypothetical protein
MMVVIYFSKKRLKEATRAWIDTSLFGSLLQIVSTTHKKISKPRHTSYSAHRRSISWRRPCFCRRSFLLLTDFSYFPSIYFAYTVQPARAVEGLLDLSEHDDHHNAWVSRQNLHPGELSSCLYCGACCMLQVYGVIMGLNIFCNPL